jgi:hypothetical protein
MYLKSRRPEEDEMALSAVGLIWYPLPRLRTFFFSQKIKKRLKPSEDEKEKVKRITLVKPFMLQ